VRVKLGTRGSGFFDFESLARIGIKFFFLKLIIAFTSLELISVRLGMKFSTGHMCIQ